MNRNGRRLYAVIKHKGAAISFAVERRNIDAVALVEWPG